MNHSRKFLYVTLLGSVAMELHGQSSLNSIAGHNGETMSILAWVVLGLVAGFVGSKIVNRRGEGIFLDILLGIVGAVAGGWLFRLFGASGVSGLNLYSLFVAVIGAIVFLMLYHLVFRRRSWYGS